MSNPIFDFTPNTCLYQGTAFTLVGSPVYSPARVDFYFSGDLTLATHIFKCKITKQFLNNMVPLQQQKIKILIF